MRKVLAVAAAGFMLALGAAFTTHSAMAASGDHVWKACATSGVSDARPNGDDCTSGQVVRMDDGVSLTFAGAVPANIEALELPGWTVSNGDPITFEYNGECGGGSPRVYITVKEKIYNTADSAQPCGVDIGDGWKKVTYNVHADGELKAAKIDGWDVAAAGVVVDNPLALVRIRNVSIGDNDVNFKARKLVEVTPRFNAEESVSDATCEAAGTLTLPDQDGVKFTRDPATGTGEVTVTATAEQGYKLTEGTHTWKVNVPAKLPADSDECKEPTTEPTVTPTTEPTTEPTASPTVAPTTIAPGNGGGVAPTTSNVSGDLPLTGSSKGTLIGISVAGVLLAIGGGLLMFVARRRRDSDGVEFTP